MKKKEFNDFIKSKNNDWIDYIKGCLFVFYDEIGRASCRERV